MKASVAALALGASLVARPPPGPRSPAAGAQRAYQVTVTSTASQLRRQTGLDLCARDQAADPRDRSCSCTGPAHRPRWRSTSPYKDYSWMAFLARAGFDVYSMDMEGYGPSTRPPAMDDPLCRRTRRRPSIRPRRLTSRQPSPSRSPPWARTGPIFSAVADWVLARTTAKTLDWSAGRKAGRGTRLHRPAPRQGLAAWWCWLRRPINAGHARRWSARAPAEPTRPLTSQSEAEFMANWDRQAPCAGQYEPGMYAADGLGRSDQV